jgi:hypothetical protein
MTICFRHHSWAGITQTFSVQGGHNYKFSGYIKIKTIGQGKLYTRVDVILNYNNGNAITIYNMLIVKTL